MPARRPTLSELMALLRCPATGAELALRDGSLQTPDGSRVYPVVRGIPILIARERSLFDPDDYCASVPSVSRSVSIKRLARQLIRRLLNRPPSLSRNLVGAKNLRDFTELLEQKPAHSVRRRVLVVGGATVGVGGEALLNAEVDLIATDVALTPSVSVVCDGHDLPFADRSVDGVVCQAVLEHVLEPQRVADEIWRVLAPGGLVYSEVPFMQQVHAGAFDFTRFTHLGHRRLWRRFDEIRSGADTGPGMALGWSIQYFARSLAPGWLSPAVDRLTSLTFFWLKFFDQRLLPRPAALDAASGTYFLGARREKPLDDREIVNGYRGAGPNPRLRVRPNDG